MQASLTKISEGARIAIKYLLPYRKSVVILAIFAVVAAVTNAAVPYLAGRFIDALVVKEMRLVLGVLIAWFVLNIISNVADWRITVGQEIVGTQVHNDYLIHGFGHLLTLPFSFHKEHKIGELDETISRAARALDIIVGQVIISLTPQFLTIGILIVVAFIINIFLASILCAALMLYGLMLLRVSPKTIVLEGKVHEAYSQAFGDAYDVLENIQTVKQSGAESYEKDHLVRNFRLNAGKLWIELNRLWSMLSFSQRILVTLTQAATFALAVVLIARGELTIGELIMFNGYAFLLFTPLVILGRNWQTIQNGIVSLQKSEEILKTPSELYVPPDAIDLPDLRDEIVFDHVSFRYSEAQPWILKDISLRIQAGMTVALVGESGVGKTTFLDLISGHYYPTEGRILVDGHDLRTLNLASLRSQIAVVPQEPSLFNDTIKNNIRYGNFSASDLAIVEAAQKAHIHDFITSLPEQYEQRVGWRGIKLSTGQKQRIVIARAVLRNPRILILDEPTSALDAKTEHELQESLAALMRGRTIFIIAHRLSTVRRANTILVLHNGTIAEQGTHDELIAIPEGIYHTFYALQMQ